MCERCVEIREKIALGQRLSSAALDPLTDQKLKEFVAQLEAEIAALEANPEHQP